MAQEIYRRAEWDDVGLTLRIATALATKRHKKHKFLFVLLVPFVANWSYRLVGISSIGINYLDTKSLCKTKYAAY